MKELQSTRSRFAALHKQIRASTQHVRYSGTPLFSACSYIWPLYYGGGKTFYGDEAPIIAAHLLPDIWDVQLRQRAFMMLLSRRKPSLETAAQALDLRLWSHGSWLSLNLGIYSGDSKYITYTTLEYSRASLCSILSNYTQMLVILVLWSPTWFACLFHPISPSSGYLLPSFRFFELFFFGEIHQADHPLYLLSAIHLTPLAHLSLSIGTVCLPHTDGPPLRLLNLLICHSSSGHCPLNWFPSSILMISYSTPLHSAGNKKS